MSSGTAKRGSEGRSRAGVGPSVHYDHFIQQQLDRTRLRVKLIDLAMMSMGLIGGATLFMFLLVLVDHWLVGLSTWSRFAALALLAIGIGYYVAAWMLPVLLRRINPGYAAQAIEQSDPTLKNSVINFLMFRRDKSPSSRLVYRALQHRAATDLGRVNLDLAVDRSRLIYFGYAVVALMVIFAGYTIFSPKNVFSTVQRVTVPWADIARPSRVTIDSVLPGHTDVILGSDLTVSARVLGTRDEDQVTLFYTTEDNQTVDQAVVMDMTESGDRFSGMIPPDDGGIQQNLTYHIQAGDARSREYRVQVEQTPSIVVDRIEYRYPEYTQRPPRTVKGEGEIRGLEGTAVTVHARANHPIRRAEMQFAPSDSPSKARRIKRVMEIEGREAIYQFHLKPDQYANYQLDFVPELAVLNSDSIPTQLGAVHPIQVIRDLPPEISILTPKRRDIECPVNSSTRVEIRALDPDFRLTKVALRGRARNRDDLERIFDQEPPGYRGQLTLRYLLEPAKLGLEVGDRLRFRAAAFDNYQPVDGGPPNSTRTAEYTVRITAPDPAQPDAGAQPKEPPTPGESGTPDASEQKGAPEGGKQSQGSTDTPSANDSSSEPQPPQGGQQDSATNESESQPSESSPETSGQKESAGGSQQSGSEKSEANQESQNQSGEPQSGSPQPAAEGQQGEGSQTGEGGSQESDDTGGETGEEGKSGSGGESGESGGATGNRSEQTDEANQSKEAGNESGSQTGNRKTPAGGSSASDNRTGKGMGSSASPGESAESREPSGRDQGTQQTAQPNSGKGSSGGEPLHDGEVFERALDYFEESQEAESSDRSQESAKQPSSENNRTEQNRQAPGDTPESDDGQKTASPNELAEDGQARSGQEQEQASSEGKGEEENARGGSSEPSTPASNPGTSDPDRPREQPPAEGDSGERSRGSDSTNDRSAGDKMNGSEGDPESGGNQKQSTETEASPNGSQKRSGSPGDAEQTGGTAEASSEEQEQESAAGSDAPRNGGNDTAEGSSAGNRTEKEARDAAGERSAAERGSKEPDQAGREAGKTGPQEGRDESASGEQPDGTQRDAAEAGSPEGGSKEPSAREEQGGQSEQQATPKQEGTKSEEQDIGSDARDMRKSDVGEPGESSKRPPPAKTPGADREGEAGEEPGNRRDQRSEDARRGTAAGGSPGGGGLPSDTGSSVAPKQRKPAAADEANLEYANEATDLVLEKLEEQQEDPSKELLESLGWTPEELRQFATRWQELKSRAREQGGAAESELRDALRSLGLRPGGPGRRSVERESDNLRGLQEGNRSRPPAEILEKFNAYKKGAARGQRNGR